MPIQDVGSGEATAMATATVPSQGLLDPAGVSEESRASFSLIPGEVEANSTNPTVFIKGLEMEVPWEISSTWECNGSERGTGLQSISFP